MVPARYAHDQGRPDASNACAMLPSLRKVDHIADIAYVPRAPSPEGVAVPHAPRSAQFPHPLAAGALVALVAPAGPLRSRAEIERAEANVLACGWKPVVGAHAMARRSYLAGSDDERLADLNEALRDPSIDGIWCLRGGYGVMRILHRIDLEALRARPRPVIGFSDITALLHHVAERAGVCGVHGPCARGELSAYSRQALTSAIAGGDGCGVAPHARILREGRARGPLTGGNLALLVSLIGTPSLHLPDGAILVVEDVNEPVYRIDRMLQQLRLAGILARCAGLVFGAFTERGAGDAEENGDAVLDAVLRDAAAHVNGPVIAAAPVGHVDDQWSWPLGAVAELDASERRLTVVPQT
jgi:muramoyltetrapeptide carboxypeptidase